ncbi:MAG TPA: CBS domain-containing protein [Gemmatimonadaceae bacterium]
MTAEERLAAAFLEDHPPRAAMALERLPLAQAAAALRVVPARAAAGAVREMTPPRAADCLAALPADEAAAVVAAIPADDAATILRALDEARRAPILAALSAAPREALERTLPFPEGTAGAAMDPAVFQVAEDVPVADARDRLRRAGREVLYYIYVVDREGRLSGVLDIPELMLASARAPVATAMHRDPDRLSAWMPVALVREHPAWQRYHAVPVVDEHDRLLGAIRYQALRRLEREASGRSPDPHLLTARALGDLFRVGTAGLVAGVAAAAATAEGGDDA